MNLSWLALFLVLISLTMCGAIGSSKKFPIYGDISGLKPDEEIKLSTNGQFTTEGNGTHLELFLLPTDTEYDIKVEGNTYLCEVENGKGVLKDIVENVKITCIRNYEILANITGVEDGDTIKITTTGTNIVSNFTGDPIQIVNLGSGTQQLLAQYPVNTEYSIEVSSEDYACGIENGIGVLHGDSTNTEIDCAQLKTISGDVVGLLAGETVLLSTNEFTNTLSNGAGQEFFRLAKGTNYAITATSSSGRTCFVSDGAGTLVNNVSGVIVNCGQTFTISGGVSGLSGTDKIELTTNGQTIELGNVANQVLFSLPDGTNYDILVASSDGYICVVSNGKGTIAGANITGVSVVCTAAYMVRGSVSGLDTGDTIKLSTNGYTTEVGNVVNEVLFNLPNGTTYDIQVFSSEKYTCAITNGTGTIAGADVSGVVVNCTKVYKIIGSVSGLQGTDTVFLSTNGDIISMGNVVDAEFFSFPDGTAYSIFSSSPDYMCNITNGTGTIAGADVTGVSVVCLKSYTISGSVSGVNAGDTIRLTTGSQTIELGTTTGEQVLFTLPDGSNYDITVSSSGYTCAITNGTGTIAGADVTGVAVSCIINYKISGIVSGLNGTDTIFLSTNGQTTEVRNSTTDQLFFTLPSGTMYNILITSSGYVCNILNGAGTGTLTADVSGVAVECLAAPPPFTKDILPDQLVSEHRKQFKAITDGEIYLVDDEKREQAEIYGKKNLNDNNNLKSNNLITQEHSSVIIPIDVMMGENIIYITTKNGIITYNTMTDKFVNLAKEDVEFIIVYRGNYVE